MADTNTSTTETKEEKKGAFDGLLNALNPWVPVIVVYIAVIVTVALAVPFFKK